MNKLLALTLLALIAFAIADGDTKTEATSVTSDATSEDSDAWSRELQVEQYSDTQFKLKSKRKSGTTKEELEFWFRVDGDSGPEMRASLQNKTKSEGETEQRAVVRLYQLVEYTSAQATATGEYSGSGGSVTSLKNINWNKLNCVCDSANTACNCSVSTKNSPVITIMASFVSTPSTVDGDTTVPTTFKWGFSYEKSTSNVALIAKVATRTEQETEKSTEVEDQSTENSRSISQKKEKQVSFGTNGFFSWDTTFYVDSVAQSSSVMNSDLAKDTSSDKDESQHQVVFSFVSGTAGLMLWDPKIGFADGSSGLSTGAIVGIVIGCVAAVALIAVIVGVVIYRRRKH